MPVNETHQRAKLSIADRLTVLVIEPRHFGYSHLRTVNTIPDT